jgi:RimJ/RimL family protein N-acetyltransferase
MNLLSSERLVLRDFNKDDVSDLLALSINWNSSSGSEFEKYPTDENGCKEFLEYLSDHTIDESLKFSDHEHHFCAIYLGDKEKVIGLLAINPSDDYLLQNKKIDLGHVIHSDYQDGDIDREAIEMMVEYIFTIMTDAESITTRNNPNEEQIRPLKNLGFIKDDKNDGIYDLKKAEWKKGTLLR